MPRGQPPRLRWGGVTFILNCPHCSIDLSIPPLASQPVWQYVAPSPSSLPFALSLFILPSIAGPPLHVYCEVVTPPPTQSHTQDPCRMGVWGGPYRVNQQLATSGCDLMVRLTRCLFEGGGGAAFQHSPTNKSWIRQLGERERWGGLFRWIPAASCLVLLPGNKQTV